MKPKSPLLRSVYCSCSGIFSFSPVYDVAAVPILLSRSKHGRCNKTLQKQMTGLLSAKTVAHEIPSDIDTAIIVSTGYHRRFGGPGTMIECLTSELPRSQFRSIRPDICKPDRGATIRDRRHERTEFIGLTPEMYTASLPETGKLALQTVTG
jgi:hypothetical protein